MNKQREYKLVFARIPIIDDTRGVNFMGMPLCLTDDQKTVVGEITECQDLMGVYIWIV